MRYDEIVTATNKIMEQYTVKLTVRQIYYRLVSPPFQLFSNTINSYKQFDRILTRAREKNDVDWTRIEDRARRTEGGDYGFQDIQHYLEYKNRKLKENTFTKPIWDTQEKYVECWVEKDALASLFIGVAEGFRVLVYPSRGYSSFTKIMEALGRFEDDARGREIVILHFTDHDPSGLDMTHDIQKRLESYIEQNADDYQSIDVNNLRIERIALTIEQVRQHRLAPNPTKRADSRSRDYVAQYGDVCWELDALDPEVLQQTISRAINAEIDSDAWNKRLAETKKEEKEVDEIMKKLLIVSQECSKRHHKKCKTQGCQCDCHKHKATKEEKDFEENP